MPVERFLGAAWASVHGPADPKALWLHALKLGFKGFVVAPAPRMIDWQGLRAQRANLPVAFAGLRVSGILEVERCAEHGLGSRTEAEVTAAIHRIAEAARLARSLGIQKLILEPGLVPVHGEPGPVDLGDPRLRWSGDQAQAQMARRQVGVARALDASCRAFYRLLKDFPDVEFCLTPSRHVFGLGEPDALALLFEDLKTSRLSYWHDAAIAGRRQQLLGLDQGRWLEAFAGRLAGFTLGDTADGMLHLPPGAGIVDFGILATYRRAQGRPQPVVVELDPMVDQGEIPGVHSFLAKWGL